MGSSTSNEQLRDKVQAANTGTPSAGNGWLDLLEKYGPDIEKVLPSSMPLEQFKRIATTTINASPQLKQCTGTSIITALMRCAELQFEPGPLGYAWFVPRKDQGILKCNFQIGYQGWMELARRSGGIAKIECRAVYEGDEFDHEFGTGEFLRHKPSGESHGLYGAQKDAMQPTHVYAIAKLTSGAYQFEAMSWADAMGYRAVYAKTGKVWKAHPVPMALKTVFLRLKPWLPRSITMDRATQYDDIGAIPEADPEQPDVDVPELAPQLELTAEDKALALPSISDVVAHLNEEQYVDFEAWATAQKMPQAIGDYDDEQARAAVETWGWVLEDEEAE